ncbi:calcium-binding protein [Microvirga sp. G4-2]|uniref:calcium-binding protein n=1 Tax=Microvirga sp. G4-2 TaxID=3434467 RepID=UPI00404402DE
MGTFKLYDDALTGFDMTLAGWGLVDPSSTINGQNSPTPNVQVTHLAGNIVFNTLTIGYEDINGSPEMGSVYGSYIEYDAGNIPTGSYYQIFAITGINHGTTYASWQDGSWLNGITAADDRFFGNNYDDYIIAGSGNDIAYGNGGYDRLDGEDGIDVLYGGDGNDTAWGGTGNDRLYGDAGDDDLIGEAGADIIYGGIGDDYAWGGTENDRLYGEAGADSLVGQTGDDTLYGGNDGDFLWGESGKDTLYGDAGDDYLLGGMNNDVLKGGTGEDWFIFDTKASTSNVDTIVDFSTTYDTIVLENAIYTRLAAGALSSGAFWKSTTGKAHDSSDRIMYETDTGKLFYDADGTGSGAAVHFATISKNLTLTNKDFWIV